MEYGAAPENLGFIDIQNPEMMFVQYLPVMMPGSNLRVPANLNCFRDIIIAAIMDSGSVLTDAYVYLTAKHLFVTPDNMGNRPGWHSDGFGTDDLNYIWCDSAPTEFCVQPFRITDDCAVSMKEMEDQAREENVVVYPVKTLLKLDQGVIHRVAANGTAGYRTFVKVSVSKDKYNLKGNAHNYLFDYEWEMHDRAETRNHPSK